MYICNIWEINLFAIFEKKKKKRHQISTAKHKMKNSYYGNKVWVHQNRVTLTCTSLLHGLQQQPVSQTSVFGISIIIKSHFSFIMGHATHLVQRFIWCHTWFGCNNNNKKTKICCKAKFSPTVNTWGSPNAANRCNFTCKIPSIKKIKINNTLKTVRLCFNYV